MMVTLTHDQDFLIKALWRVVKQRESNRRRNPEKMREDARRWRAKNLERAREASRRWRAENPEKAREATRRWYSNNPDKAREVIRRSSLKNREAIKERSRRYRLRNLEMVDEKNRRWRAANPEKVRETARRWAKTRPDGWHEKRRERSRSWYTTNPEKHKENGRRWEAANPERARELSALGAHRRRAHKKKVMGDFTAEQFKALCNHFKNHCLKCGRPRKMTPDHVIPLAWADRPEFKEVALNDIDNIQPLCRSCNTSKGARSAVDYRTTPHRHCINPPMVEDFLA
jgi:hypothetical protein